jgi:hypothetical protein
MMACIGSPQAGNNLSAAKHVACGPPAAIFIAKAVMLLMLVPAPLPCLPLPLPCLTLPPDGWRHRQRCWASKHTRQSFEGGCVATKQGIGRTSHPQVAQDRKDRHVGLARANRAGWLGNSM